MNQIANPKDWVARVTGITGIALALAAFATLYFAVAKPTCLKIGLGPQVYIASKPRFGVRATLVNEGAHETIITSGELRLDNAQFTLPLTQTALQSESWEYDAEGNFQKRSPARFSDFTPFAIKPYDQASATFWFVAHDSFPLSAGHHTTELVLTDVEQQNVIVQFKIELLQSDIDRLYHKQDGKEQAGVEYPIRVISQHSNISCRLL